MKIFGKLHYDDCGDRIRQLEKALELSMRQNIDFSRDLLELSCKLKTVTLNKHVVCCSECSEKKEVEALINSVLE
jgi:hypothetical protein